MSVSLILYTIFTVPMLYLMYQRHYLAFKDHAPRQLTLLLIYIAAFVGVLKVQWMRVSLAVCLQYFEEELQNEGFCFRIVEKAFLYENKEFNFTILIELLPVASYLILYYPHDCYRCLGKDPDRNFSQYQFTERELAMRSMRYKYGVEAETSLSVLTSPNDFDR